MYLISSYSQQDVQESAKESNFIFQFIPINSKKK